jgi:hypothetical protein
MFVIADLHQKRNRDLVLKNICALYKFCPQLGYVNSLGEMELKRENAKWKEKMEGM